MGKVKNDFDHSDHVTPKMALSQEPINEMSWFFWKLIPFRKAKSYFNDFWIDKVKDYNDLLGHGTLKPVLCIEWTDEFNCFCFVLFFHADTDNNIRLDCWSYS